MALSRHSYITSIGHAPPVLRHVSAVSILKIHCVLFSACPQEEMLTPKSYSARANRTTDLRTAAYAMRCWLGRRQVDSGRAEGVRGTRPGCRERIRGNTSGEEGLKLGVKGWVGRASNHGLRSEVRERGWQREDGYSQSEPFTG